GAVRSVARSRVGTGSREEERGGVGMDALNFRNARVLVTGGAGLIGSHIVDRLVAEAAVEIIVLDNFVRGRRENLAGAMKSGRVTIVEGDIRDRALLDPVMHRIDAVFNSA